jgi:hypothetical protein
MKQNGGTLKGGKNEKNHRSLISHAVDGLLYYKVSLGKRIENFNMARALKRLFTLVFYILLT